MPTALIVDQDREQLRLLTDLFRKQGYDTLTTSSLDEARRVFLEDMPDVVMLDESVGERSSLDLLDELDVAENVEIFLMSATPSLSSASRAMRLGVTDYLRKPVDKSRVSKALQQIEDEVERASRQDGVTKSGRGLLIGESRPMQRLYRLMRKCAASDASVLLMGESGVGKELVARTIHDLSGRAKAGLLPVNCSAIPAELMESELFGHRKGSFTGATGNHRGLFERATGGTLFLDEIGEMEAPLQAKLLRVLESSAVLPVGSEKEVSVDARIIAATNRDVSEAIEEGSLREDLYYRLAQFPLFVPPLREKRDDIVLLAQHFIEQQNEKTGIDKSFDEEVLAAFKMHDWPGNVRELKNAIIHGHLLADDVINLEDLPDGIPSNMPVSGEYHRVGVGTPLVEVERRHILSTLAHFEDDKKKAAESLGISLKTLYNRLKKYQQ